MRGALSKARRVIFRRHVTLPALQLYTTLVDTIFCKISVQVTAKCITMAHVN